MPDYTGSKLTELLENNCEIRDLLQHMLNQLLDEHYRARVEELNKDNYLGFCYLSGNADAIYNLMIDLGLKPNEEEQKP